jgi:hypothetical protein
MSYVYNTEIKITSIFKQEKPTLKAAEQGGKGEEE